MIEMFDNYFTFNLFDISGHRISTCPVTLTIDCRYRMIVHFELCNVIYLVYTLPNAMQDE